MKKQLIAIGLVGLASFLILPSVVFANEDACAPVITEGMTEEALMAAKADMMGTSACMDQRIGSVEATSHGHGPSLYGSFRTGLSFGSGDASVGDFTSRWGFQGSHEVSEGLTASYRYESKFNTTNAESSGGVGHGHDAVDAIADVDEELAAVDNGGTVTADTSDHDTDSDTDDTTRYSCDRGNPVQILKDADDMATGQHAEIDTMTDFETALATADVFCGNVITHTDAGSAAAAEIDADGGPGGRLSYVSLSGGFGTVTLGQIWSASAIHYGFKIDPSYVNGVFGGASYRNGNSVSYSSSAGDVSFQVDKVLGDKEAIEFGASATLGPVGVGLASVSSGVNDSGFTGVAVSAGAAGINLTVGLGSSKDAWGAKTKTNVLHVGGAVGDTGLSYALQVANSNALAGKGDQNLIVVTNSLGSGASLIFEHVSHGDPTKVDGSLLGLKVDF